MSLESNREDFEKALAEMKVSLDAMEPCVNDAILDSLKSVVNEYEGHYSGDIDELISERDKLQDKIDELEI